MSAAEIISNILKECGYEYLSFTKMTYSASLGRYTLYLDSRKRLTRKERENIEKKTAARLPIDAHKLTMIFRQPAEGLAGDPQELSCEIKNVILELCPTLLPIVRGCVITLEDVFADIAFDIELGPELLHMSGTIERTEKYFELVYGIKLRFRNLHFDTSLAQDKQPHIDRTWVAPEPAAHPSAPATEQKEKKPEDKPKPKVIHGRSVPDSPQDISSLELDKPAVVEGDVITFEVASIKNNKFTKVNFIITDYTSSVRCSIFMRGDKTADYTEKFTGLKRVRVRGRFIEDEYSKRDENGEYDTVLEARDVMRTEKKKRGDSACEKRVELHLHTNMSSMDGISSAESYIKRAAEWGHRAIAVTDHGVVQAYPEAQTAGKKYGVKIIYGTEAYLLADAKPIYSGSLAFDGRMVVFDIETTGLNNRSCGITEIGAVRIENGAVTDRFSTFVNPGMSIPAQIVSLTGITNDMVADAPCEEEAVRKFLDFAGDDPLAAHNASFDIGFISAKSKKFGIEFKNKHFDTLAIARVHLPELSSHKLDKLCTHYKIPLKHHRAVNDAEATAQLLLLMLAELHEEGLTDISQLNERQSVSSDKHSRSYHIVLLVKNKTGLENLYRLISAAHLEHFYRKPRMPRSLIEKYREGLIIGSACCEGELFTALTDGAEHDKLAEIASFYDYIEIQPTDNNAFMIREGRYSDRAELRELNRTLAELADELGKPLVATGDCHFLDPHMAAYRSMIMASIGFKDADEQAPLYLHTTDEMLAEFAYLGEQRAYDAVIKNPNMIADMTEEIELFPNETAMPYVENAEEEITEAAYTLMHEKYGDPLPEAIAARLEKELGSIIKHGYAVLYWIAMKLVKKTNSDGYLVGSRGSVGSSLAAYAAGITEVNPLAPHYICPNCRHSDFDVDIEQYGCGIELPPAVCPICGSPYDSDGYNIPFEVFLGFNADKVPDIDLNFSSEYQGKAHKYIEELFGEEYVYRAGTIGTIQDNTAMEMIRKSLKATGKKLPRAEMQRLAEGMSGVKRSTGQHPGGLVIVPKNRSIYEFTAIQKPADKADADATTTHFDFNSMHDILIKIDILGHDNPTIIKALEKAIGEEFDPLAIPLNDPGALSLFSSVEALGITPEDIMGIKVGTLGIPEFGTRFVQGMLLDTMPKTVNELIMISGLSHGTNVWMDNADQLIASGTAVLKETICTRDDIMITLINKGVEKKMAFDIMESVRKGKWAKGKEKRQADMEAAIAASAAPKWYIDSCRKISYMFPKAHAVAYVIMALRIAYCKVYYPKQFYAAYFTVRGEEFDSTEIKGGYSGIKARLAELDAKGKGRTARENLTIVHLELVMEMYARGIAFLPVDLHKSRAKEYVVEGDNIRLSFLSIPSLGAKKAETLEKVMDTMDIRSIDELKKEAGLSKTVIDNLREAGCFAGMSESAQLSIFDIV